MLIPECSARYRNAKRDYDATKASVGHLSWEYGHLRTREIKTQTCRLKNRQTWRVHWDCADWCLSATVRGQEKALLRARERESEESVGNFKIKNSSKSEVLHKMN